MKNFQLQISSLFAAIVKYFKSLKKAAQYSVVASMLLLVCGLSYLFMYDTKPVKVSEMSKASKNDFVTEIREKRYDPNLIEAYVENFYKTGHDVDDVYNEIIDSFDFFKVALIELYRREGYCPLPYYDVGVPAYGFGTRYSQSNRNVWDDWKSLGVDKKTAKRLMDRSKYADQRREIVLKNKMSLEVAKAGVYQYLERDNEDIKKTFPNMPRNKRIAFLSYCYNAGYGSSTRNSALYKKIVKNFDADVKMTLWVKRAATENHKTSRILEACMWKCSENPKDFLMLLKMHKKNMEDCLTTNYFELSY